MLDLTNLPVIPTLLAASAACAWAAVLAHGRPRICGPREPRLWGMFAAVFLAFVAMKLLGLTEGIEDAARDRLRADGMYGDRRIIQLAVVLGAGIFGISQSIWYAKHISHRWKRYRWPIIGALVIVCFGAIRAVSLHELDALGPALMAAKVVVEIAASTLAAWGAWQRIAELKGVPASHRGERTHNTRRKSREAASEPEPGLESHERPA